MCITAVGNLTQESIKKGDSKVYFSGNRDIIPFIDLHWDSITTTAKRTFQSRFSLVCIQYYYVSNKYYIYIFFILSIAGI